MTVEKKPENSEKILCPECGTELVPVNGKTPEECPKCGFDLESWTPFQRLVKAYNKMFPPEPAKPEVKGPEIIKPRPKFLNGLRRKRKS